MSRACTYHVGYRQSVTVERFNGESCSFVYRSRSLIMLTKISHRRFVSINDQTNGESVRMKSTRNTHTLHVTNVCTLMAAGKREAMRRPINTRRSQFISTISKEKSTWITGAVDVQSWQMILSCLVAALFLTVLYR